MTIHKMKQTDGPKNSASKMRRIPQNKAETYKQQADTHPKKVQHIPDTHPRAESLRIRHRLTEGFENGLVAAEGLLAHGRGEAFDYLLGEETGPAARTACRAAAALLLLAERPVISVNGNLAALCPAQTVRLAAQTGAALEINLFYDSEKRRRSIATRLCEHGGTVILGLDPHNKSMLHGTDSARRSVDTDGIMASDVVVVPLEDGDRTDALKMAGKKVVAFDLNPMSRTARAADVTIVDNVVRAIDVLIEECRDLESADPKHLGRIVAEFDNSLNLGEALSQIQHSLQANRSCEVPP